MLEFFAKVRKAIEGTGVATATAEAGLLSGAEQAGVFSTLENLGAFSLIESLLPTIESLKLLTAALDLARPGGSRVGASASALLAKLAGSGSRPISRANRSPGRLPLSSRITAPSCMASRSMASSRTRC